MSIDNIDTIVRREIQVRRRNRFYLTGFATAVAIIVVAVVTAI